MFLIGAMIDLFRSRSTPTSKLCLVLSANCFMLGTLVTLASCRDYVFPMCPPKEWKIPGGKIRSDGKVDYQLLCEFGYTPPLLYNSSKSHDCMGGKSEKLPRRCVRKFFAYVTLQYAIGVETKINFNGLCNSKHVLQKLKTLQFKRKRYPHMRKYRRKGSDDKTERMNDQFDITLLQIVIKDCGNLYSTFAYVRIQVKNVQIGNGTQAEIRRYYNFVISETFKNIKKLLFQYGYVTVRGLTEPRTLAGLAHSSRPEAIASQRSRQRSFVDPGSYAAANIRNTPPLEQMMKKPGAVEEGEEKLDDGAFFMRPISTGAPSSNASGFSIDASWTDLQTHRSGKKIAPGQKDRQEFDLKSEALTDTLSRPFSYVGLYKSTLGGPRPLLFHCPPHLELRHTDDYEDLCVGCGKGWFLQRKGTTKKAKCYPCGPGFYSDVDTATECEPCPVKYMSSPWDAASIDECFKVTAPTSDQEKWIVMGFMLPTVYISAVSVAVVWISKLTIGSTTYERKPPRKSHKRSN